jgi:hypothetical protein
MTMKRSKEPWMPADDFGRSLPRGIGVNLLVRDMAAELGLLPRLPRRHDP